jgi:peptide/nickel transport system substrate-binding protein
MLDTLQATRSGGPRRSARWVTGLVTAALLLVTGCTAGPGHSGSGAGPLRVSAITTGPFTRQFNPLLSATGSLQANGYAVLTIYEQLMLENYSTGTLQPWLASSFAWSKDGRSLTLHIRPNVKWSDGTPLTAADVAFTFDLIKKYEALNSQSLPLAGATAPSPDTAVITFDEPAYQQVWWRNPIVPQHVFAKVADPVKYTNPNPVGSGPYMLSSFSAQVISLKKNPYYWQTGKPAVKDVQYLAYDSDSSAIAALQAGEVDWISPAITDPQSVVSRGGSKIGYWSTPQNAGVVFLLPNSAVYPTSDPALRQAISAALDRKAISQVGLGGINPPAESPVGLNPGSKGELDLIAPQYKSLRYGAADPAKARNILTAAGYRAGGNGSFTTPRGKPLNVTLMVPTSSAFGNMVGAAQVIVKQLGAAGIKVTIKNESPTAWRDDINTGNYELSMRSIGGTLAFYQRYATIFSQHIAPVGKTALDNYERYANPAAAPLLKRYQAAAPGSDEELAALAGLQQIMVTDVPVIPLYLTTSVGIWRTDRFTGWPSETNPYATSIGASPSASWVVANLAPVAR